jgi:hypothetical protein
LVGLPQVTPLTSRASQSSQNKSYQNISNIKTCPPSSDNSTCTDLEKYDMMKDKTSTKMSTSRWVESINCVTSAEE